MNIRTTLTSLAIVATCAACTDDTTRIKGEKLPLTRTEVIDTSVANVRTIARELWDTQRWLVESDSADGFGDLFGAGEGTEEPINTSTYLFLPDEEVDFESWLQSVEDGLREHVFVASQIESETSTAIVYRLDPDVFCDSDWEGDAFSTCQDVLTRLEVRVRVVSFAAHDLDATLLLGPDRKVALRVELHRDLASAELMLEPATLAFQALIDAMRDDDSAPIDDFTATGAVRVAVRLLADHQVRLASEVTQPLTLGGTIDGDAVTFEAAVGSAALDVNTADEVATADLDLGRVALAGPKRLIGVFADDSCEYISVDDLGNEVTVPCEEEPASEEPELEGTIGFSLGRLAALVELDDPTRHLDIKGLVLGPVTVTADLATIVELTFGRALAPVDVDADLDGDDALDITFSQDIEAGLLLRLGLAPDIFEDDMGWAADEDLGASTSGGTPALSFTNRGLVMTAGTLTLTSRHARVSPLVIPEGQCASRPEEVEVDDSEEETSSHPFDFDVAATCPAEATSTETF